MRSLHMAPLPPQCSRYLLVGPGQSGTEQGSSASRLSLETSTVYSSLKQSPHALFAGTEKSVVERACFPKLMAGLYVMHEGCAQPPGAGGASARSPRAKLANNHPASQIHQALVAFEWDVEASGQAGRACLPSMHLAVAEYVNGDAPSQKITAS